VIAHPGPTIHRSPSLPKGCHPDGTMRTPLHLTLLVASLTLCSLVEGKDDGTCGRCQFLTEGPCLDTATGVCWPYTRPGDCPRRTKDCSCPTCTGGTSGPCHSAAGPCVGYSVPELQRCPVGGWEMPAFVVVGTRLFWETGQPRQASTSRRKGLRPSTPLGYACKSFSGNRGTSAPVQSPGMRVRLESRGKSRERTPKM
jgi:hypothetical protein